MNKKLRFTWVQRKVLLDAIAFRLEEEHESLTWFSHAGDRVYETYGSSPAALLESLRIRLVRDHNLSGKAKKYRLSWDERTWIMDAISYTRRHNDELSEPERHLLVLIHNKVSQVTSSVP